MKVILITPGTGSYYCGVCMRDNALAKELIRQGHDAVMLPMYLPLTLDEAPVSSDAPIFYGGINVYLQQKFAIFRHTPRWLDRLLNNRTLLRQVAQQSGMTGGAEIGELTHSMLMGEEGRQAKELETLVEWLLTYGKPDAIWLSTALLVGLARRIKEALQIPVLCSLQGEDAFLDGLAQPWKDRCWEALAERSRDVDRFIAPSCYFAELMQPRMQLRDEQLRIIPNGVGLDEFVQSREEPPAPVIGYLARMIEGKGLRQVVEAFILLRRRGQFPTAKLRCAGAVTREDERYVTQLQQLLADAGCAEHTEFLPNVSREEKTAFLRTLTLLSVPATYGEAFGLYLLEAMAAGVPVVQPRQAAFPEIIEATGGGILYEPATAEALASAWEELLGDPSKVRSLGERGRAAAEREYSLPVMAQRFVSATEELLPALAGGRPSA
jgi:glycosyltransferase involved in cell wall biosynthesis